MPAKTAIAHLNMSPIDRVAIDLDPVLPSEVTDVFISTASHFLLFFFSSPNVKHHLS